MTISRKFAVGLLGTFLVLVGIAGLVLPVLPGWLLIIAGLAVLRREFGWAGRLADRSRTRSGEAPSPRADQDELAA
jgi:uncharacterized membrane protein YbaN (DUF454 family)